MLGVGVFEILMIFVVALLVLGPEQLPKAARTLAKIFFEFRKVSEDLRLSMMGADILSEQLPKELEIKELETREHLPVKK